MNMQEKIKSTMRGELEQVVVHVAKFEDEYWLCINPEEVIDAILDAMRAPDDGVGLVGQKTRDTGSGAACIWMDMIDAIKAGK